MAVRFRIRTSQGQELSFASHEIFEEFVRSGDLAPEDLVYDGETGEWAPARTHPLVLAIEYAREEEGGAPSAPEPEKPRPGDAEPPPRERAAAGATEATEPGPAKSVDSLDLDLALTAEKMTPEEQAKAFVKKMEAERAMDLEFGSESRTIEGLRIDHTSPLSEMQRARPAPARLAAKRSSPSARAPGERTGGAKPPPARSNRKRTKKGGAGRVVFLMVVLGALAAAAYYGAQRLDTLPEEERADSVIALLVDPGPDPSPQPTAEPPPGDGPRPSREARPVTRPLPTPPPEPSAAVSQPVIADTEEAVRERAQERFLSATQAQVGTLRPIPEGWMRGPYVALPSEHAVTRALWEQYGRTARSVRAGQEARYRTAYERALDDAGVLDERRRNARLEAAARDFAIENRDTRAHWERVEALALAAVQSHDALLRAEGLIVHDPSGSTGRTSGLAVGTRGRDSDAQLLLDQVTQLVEAALDADGMGPREASNVRAWVWDGFLAAVTR